MSNVAKHNHKQEREGDNGKKAGVDLLSPSGYSVASFRFQF